MLYFSTSRLSNCFPGTVNLLLSDVCPVWQPAHYKNHSAEPQSAAGNPSPPSSAWAFLSHSGSSSQGRAEMPHFLSLQQKEALFWGRGYSQGPLACGQVVGTPVTSASGFYHPLMQRAALMGTQILCECRLLSRDVLWAFQALWLYSLTALQMSRLIIFLFWQTTP